MELEVRARIMTIQTTALLDQVEFGKKSWRIDETCGHSDATESPPANARAKNLLGVKQLYLFQQNLLHLKIYQLIIIIVTSIFYHDHFIFYYDHSIFCYYHFIFYYDHSIFHYDHSIFYYDHFIFYYDHSIFNTWGSI